MDTFLTIIHVLVCTALIGIVLLQQGKGADMGAAFGGSSQTFFGSAGATTFLGKLTAGAAILFMVTSLGLGLAQRSGLGGSDTMIPEEANAPFSAMPPVTGAPAASAPIAPEGQAPAAQPPVTGEPANTEQK